MKKKSLDLTLRTHKVNVQLGRAYAEQSWKVVHRRFPALQRLASVDVEVVGTERTGNIRQRQRPELKGIHFFFFGLLE